MIDREKLKGMLLRDEPWGEIIPPKDLDFRTPKIREQRKTAFSWRVFVPSAVAASVLAAVIAVALFPRGPVVEIRQPYNGENRVEVIGSLNGWRGRIPMTLDPTGTCWKALVRVPAKGVYEYQLIIDDLIYSAGDNPVKITGPDGQEKALIMVRGGDAGADPRDGDRL